MSASLLRRGLELLADDVKDHSRVNKKKAQRQQTTNLAAAGMLPVDAQRQGANRPIKRWQSRPGSTKSKATVKNKPIKSALEEFKRKQRKSHMSANLKYFTDTSRTTTQSETKKIISHHTGRQSRNRLNRTAQKVQKVQKAQKPQSLFTEEEFQQFQKEYFGNLTK